MSPLARGYECHVTFAFTKSSYVQTLRWHNRLHRYGSGEPVWKFSQIIGDPVLGDKPYCYLSAWHEDYDTLQEWMGQLVAVAWDYFEMKPLRTKIEAVVYDVRW